MSYENVINNLDSVINNLASVFHENWRQGRIKAGLEKREKTFIVEGVEVVHNILVSWDVLPLVARIDNLEAARVAYEIYSICKDDLNGAGEHIHKEWVKRNLNSIKNDPSRQHLLKPFCDLDKEEQEKDLEQYRIVLEFFSNK
jgi:hypothetical protein